jgi:hypothetical protein
MVCLAIDLTTSRFGSSAARCPPDVKCKSTRDKRIVADGNDRSKALSAQATSSEVRVFEGFGF